MADRAGLEAGMEVLGINGSLFTPARLQSAVQATKGSKTSDWNFWSPATASIVYSG